MKKLIKILPIIMVVLMIMTTVAPVFATTIGSVPINPNGNAAGTQISTVGNKILGVIQVVGTVIAVGVLMVLGIKYMMGSAEEKAEYKKTMIPYLVGALLLFAAVTLGGWIYNVATTITTE